jgi:hypothetical protein
MELLPVQGFSFHIQNIAGFVLWFVFELYADREMGYNPELVGTI